MSTSSLKVLRAGPYISVQDEGRAGYLRFGVAQGGAMDPRAFEEGRLLVGNKPGAAALEMFGLGGRFEVHGQAICAALTGAVFSAELAGKAIAPQTSFIVHPGQVLKIGAAVHGNYGLLSIAGGIDTKPILGSRSTHVRAGFGGMEGRCLRPGDDLPIGLASGPCARTKLVCEYKGTGQEVRIIWGAQAKLFGKQELARFTSTAFRITHEIDRMGAKLTSDTPPLHAKKGLVAISGPIALGDIQVPGNGRPVVLLADRQPTGGYPRIATIIGADIADFIQRPVGSLIKFKPVSERRAIEALKKQSEQIKNLADHLVPHRDDPYDSGRLLAQNLISGVVSSFDQSPSGDLQS